MDTVSPFPSVEVLLRACDLWETWVVQQVEALCFCGPSSALTSCPPPLISSIQIPSRAACWSGLGWLWPILKLFLPLSCPAWPHFAPVLPTPCPGVMPLTIYSSQRLIWWRGSLKLVGQLVGWRKSQGKCQSVQETQPLQHLARRSRYLGGLASCTPGST